MTRGGNINFDVVEAPTLSITTFMFVQSISIAYVIRRVLEYFGYIMAEDYVIRCTQHTNYKICTKNLVCYTQLIFTV